jgi:hypothetical protein
VRDFESPVLRWAFWSLLFALALGGHPWKFPGDGKWWLEGLNIYPKLGYTHD